MKVTTNHEAKLPDLHTSTKKWTRKMFLISVFWSVLVGTLAVFLFQRTDMQALSSPDFLSFDFYSAAFHALATGFATLSCLLALAVFLPNLFLVGRRLDGVQQVLGRQPDDVPDSVYFTFLLDERDDYTKEESKMACDVIRGARMSYQRAVLFYLSFAVLLSSIITPFGGYLYFLRLRNEVWGTPAAILLYQRVMEQIHISKEESS